MPGICRIFLCVRPSGLHRSGTGGQSLLSVRIRGGGDQDQRDLLVKFSKKNIDQYWKKFHSEISWLDLTVDELILVSGYEIGNVSVHAASGIATVVYQQMASTKGVGVYDRTFIKDVKPNQIVKLNLHFDGKRWWVYNPGLPRVSSDVMTKLSKEIYQLYLDGEKKSALTPLELRSFKKLKENIKVLESLDK